MARRGCGLPLTCRNGGVIDQIALRANPAVALGRAPTGVGANPSRVRYLALVEILFSAAVPVHRAARSLELWALPAQAPANVSAVASGRFSSSGRTCASRPCRRKPMVDL